MNNVKVYSVSDPDYKSSPSTGMTRKHWIECGKLIVENAFGHVNKFEELLIFPDIPGKTYPKPGDPQWKYKSAMFEGLRRTMSVAAPLMHVEPDIKINGYLMRDYYNYHLIRAMTPGSSTAIPEPSELEDGCYQFSCELGGLCMLLLKFPDVCWPYMLKEDQDTFALMLSKWAHARTNINNWRWFNIMMLTFLKLNGYPIDEELLEGHLDYLLSCYAGDGWYRERHFDFYSLYVYHLYPIVWSRAYGDKNDPQRVEIFDKYARRFLEDYPMMFGRNGHTIMWGRSVCYRLAVAGGFPLAFSIMKPYGMDAGWARRLCSGALLQFVTREDFWVNGIPSLGFYGYREFLLQEYSCSASPFWMFMPFLCLALPEDSPFWTEKENDGMWETLGNKQLTRVISSPAVAVTMHGNTGTAELRTAKVDNRDSNYNRLCYSSHFPWEDDDYEGGTAMTYAFKDLEPMKFSGDIQERVKYTSPVSLFLNGEHGGVLYRQAAVLGGICGDSSGHAYRLASNYGYMLDLADIIIPGGVLRVDRDRIGFEHCLTLGHFGLPHIEGKPARVKQFEKNGYKVATAEIDGRQVALVAIHGWDDIISKVHKGKNAEEDESTIIYAHVTKAEKMPKISLLITLMLHKTDNTEWTEDELFPINSLEIKKFMPSGSVLGVEVEFKDGSKYVVDFNEIDGRRSC